MNKLRLLVALLFSPHLALGQLSTIGAAAAVRGRVLALAPTPGAAGRIMGSGKPVYLNDKVTTDASGRMQIMLLDETVFTIGPNSSMVLDEFVYDPASGAGKVSARVTQGVFRFVTGKVAKNQPSDMKVRLPSGTIGIRGTIVAGKISDSGSLVVLMGPGPANNAGENAGAIAVSNAGTEVSIAKPGFGTTVSQGVAPTPPVQVPAAVLAELTASLAPEPGSSSSESGKSEGSGSATTQQDESAPASEQSGQETAAGTQGAASVETLSDLSQASSDNTLSAVQDAGDKTLTDKFAETSSSGGSGSFSSGLATWDNVRSLTSGSATYDSGEAGASYSCTSGCSGSGNFHLQLVIDFASRQLGGGVSNIHFVNGPLMEFSSTNINAFSYNALSGNAQFTLNTSAGNHTNSAFNGTIISLNNSSTVIAANAGVSLVYNNGSDLASGSGTAPRP